MGIGVKLEQLLKEKNKKAGTLATETGISKNTIYAIIRRDSEKVNMSTLEAIAENLGVSVNYFFASKSKSSSPSGIKQLCKGENAMPTISMFYGILIRMNWKDSGQHNHPHFHAYYGDYEASFSFEGEILAGEFPKKQAALVRAWALLHEDELLANWKLALEGESTFRIDPLK